MTATSLKTGICAACHAEGRVGHACESGPCSREGLHFIPSHLAPDGRALRDARIGQVLGGYLLVQRLKRGGVDRAYAGLQLPAMLEAEVAIVQADREKLAHDNLYRQAIALARLGGHPNITRLVGFGQDSAGTWLATDARTADTTLADIVGVTGHEPLPAAAARVMLEPLVAALGALATAQLVHGEIRPEHVLVQALPGYQAFVQLGGFVRIPPQGGGPHPFQDDVWRTPEQMFQHAVNATTDAYALAVIAFAMLFGHSPFPAEDREMVLDSKRDAAWDPMVGHEDTAPIEVTHFFRAALAHDPHLRFEHDDFPVALNAALDAMTPAAVALDDRGGRPPRFREVDERDDREEPSVIVSVEPRRHFGRPDDDAPEPLTSEYFPQFAKPFSGVAATFPPDDDEVVGSTHAGATQRLDTAELEAMAAKRPPRMHK